ncbi:MAG: hypothetical protein H6Q68_1582 [Firmicutes bacterium]|nr:hypothetical protein [Bacillota bacterium]
MDGGERVADALYFVEKECVVCGEKFEVTCVRSRLALIKQDSDFCAYYKEINPYYYTVWACPHCGYAARDTEFVEVTASVATKIHKFLSSREVKVNLCGIRTREQAIVAYKLAIFYTELAADKASKRAGLYLRLGWLYREGQQDDEENKALAKACEWYEQALEKEHMPIGNLSELTVMYLVADLLWRTGEKEKAKLYLSRVVANPLAKIEKRIADLARDLWQEIRATTKTSSSNIKQA